MYKSLLFLAITFSLSACGSGSSDEPAAASPGGSDTAASTAGTNNSTTDGATTGTNDSAAEGATAGANDSAAEGTTAGSNGSTTDNTTTDPMLDGVPATPIVTDTTPVVPNTTVGVTGADVVQFGLVNISNDDGEVSFTASFSSLSTAVAFPTVTAEFRPTLDVCDVSVIDLGVSFTPPNIPSNITGADVASISAGDVLTISSPAGSYAELKKTELFGFTIYAPDEATPLTAPSPSGLTISIPGDVFPAFTNVSIPDVEPLVVNSPTVGGPITSDTAFSWTPSANPDSFIEIGATAIATSSAQLTSVDCTVLDDGSFEFPAAIKAQLGADFAGFGSLDRQALNIVQTGNTILILSSESE